MMNYKKIYTSALALIFTTTLITAQKVDDGAMTTTSKTVTINKGDQSFKRTVEVSTMETEEANLYNMPQGTDTDNVKPMVTKTVKIDNDKDEAFDEKIVFSYRAYAPQDFVLISDGNDMMVAVDQGEELTIEKDMSLATKNSGNNVETYVFTDKNGQKIEFMVQEHIKQWDAASGSR